MKRIIIFTAILCILKSLTAQSIVGTWQGSIGDDEFLQINVILIKDKVCGYSWDYNYTNKKDYCKAHFNGSYNSSTQTLYFSGYSFLENSGGHVLIQLKATLAMLNGKWVLRGLCRTAPTPLSSGGYPMEVLLYKTANKPTTITATMRECQAEYKAQQKNDAAITPKQTAPSKAIPTPPKPKAPVQKPIVDKAPIKVTKPTPKVYPKKDTAVNKTTPIIKVDTLTKQATPLVIPQTINGRKNKEQSRIVLNERNITLALYDNGTVDGDAVSIYYNGKKIINNQKLSTIPITITLTLDANTNIHSLVMYAENLGTIPPNTALIIVTTASKKRYELYSSATLQQNAELIFEYKEK